MEIRACEESGEEETVFCPACGSGDLEPVHQEGATGAPSWGMMTRLAVKCSRCGDEAQLSWPGRVRFIFVRQAESA